MRRPWSPQYLELDGERVCAIPLSKGLEAIIDTRFVDAVLPYAWCAVSGKMGTEYAYTKEDLPGGRRRTLRLHQLIGRLAGIDGVVDHKNGNGLDCRETNLRSGDGWRNRANQRKVENTSSRYKGVCWGSRDEVWISYITVNRKRKHLGSFYDEVKAAQAYDTAAKAAWGVYANLNFKEAA